MLNDTKSSGWRKPYCSDAHGSDDTTLFSSSLPVLPHEKLNLTEKENVSQTLADASTGLHQLPQSSESADIEVCALGSLLPDDENDLLAGVMDDFDLSGLPSSLEALEDYDIFGSGGGMELETEPRESVNIGVSKLNISDFGGNGLNHYSVSNGGGNISGEHPYGEHPSRTLFVRNINSNVEDSELKELFEEYGDIRTLYTACKHRGFVMISYYDIRAARAAMRMLQNKPVRRRKLDIHFSIPKDNPSEKDINQGTLVVFNLDSSVSNEELHQIFGAFGEIKEIRETPHKRHHKFIEYYDVRAAEAALKSLNRSDIAGKRIKLEPSRPGGTRRNYMLQLNQDTELDDSRAFRHQIGSPVMNSPPGNWLQISSAAEYSRSPIFSNLSPPVNSHLPGLAAALHPQVTSSIRIATAGNNQDRLVEHAFTSSTSNHGVSFKQPQSFSEPNMGLNRGSNPNLRPSTSNGYGAETLSGPQFLWGSQGTRSERSSSLPWPATSVGPQFLSNGKPHAFPYTGQRSGFTGSSHYDHHHVGSAPSGVAFDRHFGFFPNSPDTSLMGPKAFGGRNMGTGEGGFTVNVGTRPIVNPGIHVRRNLAENASMRMMPSSNPTPVFFGNGNLSGLGPTTMESLTECGRRWVENNGNQVENRNQFQIDLEKVAGGKDARTTLMIKNIPNKYTSKMLLAAIDERHQGLYDFFYLPIDFKNKCNVGYAFINMLNPSYIVSFYEAFNGKRWEKFNSEKVASLAYARIQGKAALVAHFENSSLMNEDKRCRPIVFHSDGLDKSDQLIPANLNSSLNIIRQLNDSLFGDSPLTPEPTNGSVEQRKR